MFHSIINQNNNDLNQDMLSDLATTNHAIIVKQNITDNYHQIKYEISFIIIEEIKNRVDEKKIIINDYQPFEDIISVT